MVSAAVNPDREPVAHFSRSENRPPRPRPAVTAAPPELLQHPRGDLEECRSPKRCPVPVPPAEQLRPFARALLALAIEVRNERLAMAGTRRSDGPRSHISKSGRPPKGSSGNTVKEEGGTPCVQ
jgi:hypothetical protein